MAKGQTLKKIYWGKAAVSEFFVDDEGNMHIVSTKAVGQLDSLLSLFTGSGLVSDDEGDSAQGATVTPEDLSNLPGPPEAGPNLGHTQHMQSEPPVVQSSQMPAPPQPLQQSQQGLTPVASVETHPTGERQNLMPFESAVTTVQEVESQSPLPMPGSAPVSSPVQEVPTSGDSMPAMPQPMSTDELTGDGVEEVGDYTPNPMSNVPPPIPGENTGPLADVGRPEAVVEPQPQMVTDKVAKQPNLDLTPEQQQIVQAHNVPEVPPGQPQNMVEPTAAAQAPAAAQSQQAAPQGQVQDASHLPQFSDDACQQLFSSLSPEDQKQVQELFNQWRNSPVDTKLSSLKRAWKSIAPGAIDALASNPSGLDRVVWGTLLKAKKQ